MTAACVDPVAADWERFSRLRLMHNHWDRAGWWPGRQSLHWFLTFGDAGDLHSLAAACQQRLDYPFLDPVPAGGLHLTVRRLAFADEVTPAQVDTAVAVAAGRCRALVPFSLQVGPLSGSAGALRFTVAPWEPLVGLRGIAGDAAAAAGAGQVAAPVPGQFRPHIGIAYCNSTVPTAAVVDRVTVLRDLPPVGVRVQALTLVRLRRENHTYRWETAATLPLGSGPPADSPDVMRGGRVAGQPG